MSRREVQEGPLFCVREGRAAVTHVDGELVAVDLETETYFVLNGSGTLLWQSLVDGASEASLRDQLVSTYGISPSRASADTAAFLRQLEERGLLDARPREPQG